MLASWMSDIVALRLASREAVATVSTELSPDLGHDQRKETEKLVFTESRASRHNDLPKTLEFKYLARFLLVFIVKPGVE